MKRVNWVDLSHFIPVNYSTNYKEEHGILLLIRVFLEKLCNWYS